MYLFQELPKSRIDALILESGGLGGKEKALEIPTLQEQSASDTPPRPPSLGAERTSRECIVLRCGYVQYKYMYL